MPELVARGLAELEHTQDLGSPEQLREIQGLRRALESRTVIGQAVGIVMVRENLTADAAFTELVSRSSRTNTKLRDVAVEVVTAAERRALRS